MNKRLRYNRADIDSTLAAAKKIAQTRTCYVCPTAYGYTITYSPAPFGRACWRVTAEAVVSIPNRYEEDKRQEDKRQAVVIVVVAQPHPFRPQALFYNAFSRESDGSLRPLYVGEETVERLEARVRAFENVASIEYPPKSGNI